MSHYGCTLRRTKLWSAAWHIVEHVSGAMSGRSGVFTGIPMLEVPILAFIVLYSKPQLYFVLGMTTFSELKRACLACLTES